MASRGGALIRILNCMRELDDKEAEKQREDSGKRSLK